MTPLTEQQIADNVAAVEAWLNKEKVEVQYRDTPADPWEHEPNIEAFDFGTFYYRPAPDPSIRWWSRPQDVPGPVCWIKYGISAEMLITVVGSSFVCSGRSIFGFIEIEKLKLQYSLDRKTWLACTVTEEVK